MAGKKGQHYLTEDERYIMEGMLLAGAGPTEIARKMGICRQTVYNEMKRGLYVHTCDLQDQIRYSADKAQQIHEYNQTAKGRPCRINGRRRFGLSLTGWSENWESGNSGRPSGASPRTMGRSSWSTICLHSPSMAGSGLRFITVIPTPHGRRGPMKTITGFCAGSFPKGRISRRFPSGRYRRPWTG